MAGAYPLNVKKEIVKGIGADPNFREVGTSRGSIYDRNQAISRCVS